MQTYICEIAELKQWVVNALPNQKYIYFSGWSLSANLLSNRVRELTYEYARKGEVYLVQYRNQDTTDYIVVKASKPPVYKLIPVSERTENRQNRQRATREVLQWMRNQQTQS